MSHSELSRIDLTGLAREYPRRMYRPGRRCPATQRVRARRRRAQRCSNCYTCCSAACGAEPGTGWARVCRAVSLALVVVGCASPSLMPEAQAVAIKDRDRALASRADAIHAAISQSGQVGALAFLDAADGRLVVLPGDSPADAWSRYTTSPESGTGRVSVPPVLTFVHRADVRQGSRDRDPERPATTTGLADIRGRAGDAGGDRTARARRVDRGDEGGGGRARGHPESLEPRSPRIWRRYASSCCRPPSSAGSIRN